jgi:hypothetical protein
MSASSGLYIEVDANDEFSSIDTSISPLSNIISMFRIHTW